MTDDWVNQVPEGMYVRSGSKRGELEIVDAQDHIWVTLHDGANGDPSTWRETIANRIFDALMVEMGDDPSPLYPEAIKRDYEIIFRVQVESEVGEYEPIVVDRAINSWKHDLLGNKHDDWEQVISEIREVL